MASNRTSGRTRERTLRRRGANQAFSPWHRVIFGTFFLGILLPVPGRGQQEAAVARQEAVGQCRDGMISSLSIHNHSIFQNPVEERRFAWAYNLVNTLHITTREEFIRKELLFEEGECLQPHLLAETERLLREFRFISAATIVSEPRADGNHDVVVETRDEWTTHVNVRVAMEDGFHIEGIDLREENFLGRGALISLFHRERDERQDFGMTAETPRLFGTRWNAGMTLGRTRVGWLMDQTFIFPFVGEIGRLAARQRFTRREELFTYVTGTGQEYTHVLVPVFEEGFEAAGAIRVGEPGNLYMVGFGVSRDALNFLDFPSGAEQVRDSDFGDLTPAGDEMVDPIRSQITPRATTRLNLLLGQRRIRYEARSGLDAAGVQDIRLGTDVALTLGRSLDVFGTAPAPNDFFTRLDVFAGGTPGNLVIQGKLNMEGRRVFETPGRTWRDVFTELDTYVYWQPEVLGSHTFFGRISSSAGWGVEAPFQLTLGGRDGLTGYRAEAFPVGRRTIVSLEDRIAFRWPAPNFMDLGMSIFAAVGAGAAGDVPFGRDSGVKASAGAGLRIGFPAGTGTVVRLDLAFPVEQGAGLADTIFRFSIGEIAGIARGYGDPQMARSLRAGVTSDFTGLAH
jgi:hypothetical protein